MAQEHTCAHSSADEEGRGTTLLDLSDDLFGVIYMTLPPTSKPKVSRNKDREAFRHSCKTLYRSKAVNSNIDYLSFSFASLEEEESFQKLEAFPPCAELSAMCICIPSNLDQTSKKAAFQRMLDSHVLITRLSTVKRLYFKFSEIDEECSALPILYPQLQEAHFCDCGIHGNCLGKLAAEMQLHSLTLDQCHLKVLSEIFVAAQFFGSNLEKSFGQILAFKGLETLYIGLGNKSPLPVDCLSELRLLRSLRLAWCKPTGLDVLLQKLPLRELHLFDADLPEGFEFVSESLQTLVVNILSLPFCSALPPSGLPTLCSLRLESYHGKEGILDLREAASVDLSSSLLRFKTILMVACEELRLLGSTNWSSGKCSSVLRMLSAASITGFSSTVRGLTLHDWNMGPGFMLLLSGLFPNAETLVTDERNFWSIGLLNECIYHDTKNGLINAYTHMKSLRRIDLSLVGSYVFPSDCWRVLKAAHACGRPFHLNVKVDDEHEPDADRIDWRFQDLIAGQADSVVQFDFEVDDWSE